MLEAPPFPGTIMYMNSRLKIQAFFCVNTTPSQNRFSCYQTATVTGFLFDIFMQVVILKTKEKNMVIMLEIVMALKLYKFTSLCFERKAHAHCTQ